MAYMISDIEERVPGIARGGDRRFLKVGLRFEVTGPCPQDGGPTLYAACPDLRTARAVANALELKGGGQ